MRVITMLTGTTPLVQHNIRLADPDDEFTKEIAKLTSKRTKSQDDRESIAHLEFLGSLYVGRQGPFVPSANLRKCFAETAVIRKLKKAMLRAAVPIEVELPIRHDGPTDPEALWLDPKYRYTTSVGVSGRKVTRTRPMFPTWSLEAEWELLTDALDFDAFKWVAETAGLVEGLGDNRVNNYGRFTTEVKQL
jgi:hypothetical protein